MAIDVLGLQMGVGIQPCQQAVVQTIDFALHRIGLHKLNAVVARREGYGFDGRLSHVQYRRLQAVAMRWGECLVLWLLRQGL
jgi:hypothetical protein